MPAGNWADHGQVDQGAQLVITCRPLPPTAFRRRFSSMTEITRSSDRSPAELRAIAADLRAGDRPDDPALRRIAAELEEIAAAK